MPDLREWFDVASLMVAGAVGMTVMPTLVDGRFWTGIALAAGIPVGAIIWFVWMRVVDAVLNRLSGLRGVSADA